MRHNVKLFKAKLLALSVASVSTIGVVHAEEAAWALEEVVVTAQKRSQSTQDLGIAVAAISGDDLKNKGIDDIGGIVQSISNVELQDITGGGMPVMIVRGIGLQDIRVNNTPTTPFYIDEVYQASIAQTAFTMFDVERVEILKGPQGGLYGRNATGGAVQVISQKPDFDGSNGYVNLGLSKWNRTEVEAAFGTNLSDTVAVRVAGKQVKSDDTYTYSTTENKNHGEADAWGARAMLRIVPNDDIDVLIKVHGGEDRSETDLLRAATVYSGGTPFLNNGMLVPGVTQEALATSICSTPGAASCYTMDGRTGSNGGVHDSASSTLPALDNQWSGISARIDWQLGDYSLTSITAYDEMNHGRTPDFDGHGFEAQHVDYRSLLRSKSQELRLAREGESFSWIVGASYAEDSLVEDTKLFGAEGPLAGFGLSSLSQFYDQLTRSHSVYGHADWFVSDEWTVTGELRYTDELKSMDGGTAIGSSFVASIDDAKSFYEVSGKLGASWQMSENAMFYGNLSRGFKSGGFPGGLTLDSDTLTPYEQEVVHAVEFGAKTEWLDNRLRLNGAVFYYDYKDQQGIAQVVNTVTGGVIKKLGNLGDTEVKGAELDVTWLPAEGWYVQLGLGITDAVIASSDLNTKDTFLPTSDPNSDVLIEGARLPNTADWSLSATVRYEHKLTDSLDGAVQLEYSLSDDKDLSLAISEKERYFYNEDGYGLANLRYSVANEADAWQVTAFILNLSDEEYRTTARPDGLNGFYEIYGAPRSYGVSLNYRW